MSDDIDDRIGQILDGLQPRVRQRSGYKSDHILRNYDKLLRAKNELGYSYKDLAELLTKEGRPTKVPTLKYNMRRIAAQRMGAAKSTTLASTNGQPKKQPHSGAPRTSPEGLEGVQGSAKTNPSVSSEDNHETDTRKVRRLPVRDVAESTPKTSTGTIQRFTR